MPLRIVSASIAYVLSETNAQGELIAEYVSQPLRIFRAVHADVWTHGDKQAFPDQKPPTP